MSSDSVLDDILAAAELLIMLDAAPPASPGVRLTPVARTLPRRGLRTEGTVHMNLFSVVDIDCSDMT